MPRLKLRPPEKRAAYSITEVIQMTGRSRTTINRWIDKGILRTIRVPAGYRMIDAASFDNLFRGDAPRSRRKREEAA